MKTRIDKLEISFERNDNFEMMIEQREYYQALKDFERDCDDVDLDFDDWAKLNEQFEQEHGNLKESFDGYRFSSENIPLFAKSYAHCFQVTEEKSSTILGWIYWETYMMNRNESIYLRIENATLYNDRLFELIEDFKTKMSLNLKSVTKIDICIDTYKNIVRNLKNKMKDKNIDWVINGHKVKDKKKAIKGGFWIVPLRIENTEEENDETLYVKQEEGLTLCIYDKGKEIEDVSKKFYVTQDLQFINTDYKPSEIYRAEIRLNRKNIIDYLKSINEMTDEEFYYELRNDEFLMNMFDKLSKKLLRFWMNKKLRGVTDLL